VEDKRHATLSWHKLHPFFFLHPSPFAPSSASGGGYWFSFGYSIIRKWEQSNCRFTCLQITLKSVRRRHLLLWSNCVCARAIFDLERNWPRQREDFKECR
jgi:hypothetical protein